ncbi:MAG: hypothetical protein K0R36_1813 [Chryseobacterium sp.]|nr:hypothetical protein [Chryseobacterium sp.]
MNCSICREHIRGVRGKLFLMKLFLNFLLLCFIISSCEKKEFKAKVLHSFNDVDEMFQLKRYKNQWKKKINDSVTHITAQQDYFILSGDFDTKNNAKTGIWSLTNKTDSKEIQIDYIVFDKNDVFKNQIIFKEHGKIDFSNSKFYLIENKTNKGLLFKFFSPEMRDEISKDAKVVYTIRRNRKEIKTDSIVYKNSKVGRYLAEIKYDFNKGDDISGYFSEIVTAKDSKSKDSLVMGNNSIYFIEKFE